MSTLPWHITRGGPDTMDKHRLDRELARQRLLIPTSWSLPGARVPHPVGSLSSADQYSYPSPSCLTLDMSHALGQHEISTNTDDSAHFYEPTRHSILRSRRVPFLCTARIFQAFLDHAPHAPVAEVSMARPLARPLDGAYVAVVLRTPVLRTPAGRRRRNVRQWSL